MNTFTRANFDKLIGSLLTQMEGETLEYKAVLPPSRTIAMILCAFANTKGGYLVLGVREENQRIAVTGLSNDFQAEAVSRKAIDLLSPIPTVIYRYVEHQDKSLFVLAVDQSDATVTLEGKTYWRRGTEIVMDSSQVKAHRVSTFRELKELSQILKDRDKKRTDAKRRFHGHLQCVLNIIEDLPQMLYPASPQEATKNPEGKILSRILFASCADTFESYLSDLLFEIFLAKPETLKSQEQVMVQEVLKCADMQEFVEMWARRKLEKLQKGSVKGFLNDTKQISDLDAISARDQDVIEGILQIRHLYAHRNGMVDEKFLRYFPASFALKTEHQMSVLAMLEKVRCLADTVEKIDQAAISKYNLATT